jgi:hypothetical protein
MAADALRISGSSTDRMPFWTGRIGNHTEKALSVQEPMGKETDTSGVRLLAFI